MRVRPRAPGQWMDPGALGSLGVGTGFAIAAGLALPAFAQQAANLPTGGAGVALPAGSCSVRTIRIFLATEGRFLS